MSLVYIFISRSLSLWMVIHIQLPQSLSGVCVCVSSCLRLACNDGLPRIRHGAGIYQATELRNLDKSDMCEHASVSVCLFRLLWIPLFFFLFQPNFLSHYYSPERAAVHEREPGRLDSCSETSWRATVQALYANPSFARSQNRDRPSYAITFPWINLFMFSVRGGFSMVASLIMIL